MSSKRLWVVVASGAAVLATGCAGEPQLEDDPVAQRPTATAGPSSKQPDTRPLPR